MHDDSLGAIPGAAGGSAPGDVVDAVAARMTASAVPLSLRLAVCRRIAAPAPTYPVRLWVPAVAALALVMVSAWLWSRPSPVAPAATIAQRPASSPSAVLGPSPSLEAPRAVARRQQPALRRPRAATAPSAAVTATPESSAALDLVPALVVDRLAVDRLQPVTLALDAVPVPMPLRIDRMEIKPLSLP